MHHGAGHRELIKNPRVASAPAVHTISTTSARCHSHENVVLRVGQDRGGPARSLTDPAYLLSRPRAPGQTGHRLPPWAPPSQTHGRSPTPREGVPRLRDDFRPWAMIRGDRTQQPTRPRRDRCRTWTITADGAGGVRRRGGGLVHAAASLWWAASTRSSSTRSVTTITGEPQFGSLCPPRGQGPGSAVGGVTVSRC